MRARFALGLTLACASVAPAARAADATPLPLSRRTSTAIAASYTIRSEEGSGRALHAAMLREVRTLDLDAGRRTVEWADLPETTATETAQVAVATPAAGVRIVGIRITEPQLSPAALAAVLRGAPAVATLPLDETRRMRGRSAPDPGPQLTMGGAIVSTSGGLVLQVGKELTVLPPAMVRTETAAPRRRLFVDLDVTGTGRVSVGLELTALLDKVVFHPPHYVLHADPSSGRARLTGSVLVSNVSGYPLDGAQAYYTSDWVAGGRPFSRRDADAPTGVASTWAPSLGTATTPPFALPAPLAFGPHAVADAPVISAMDLPVVISSSLRIASLASLASPAEKGSETSQQAALRTLTLDVSGAFPSGLSGATLPRGQVVLVAPPQGAGAAGAVGATGTGPAQAIGEGTLTHDPAEPKVVVVEATTPQWGAGVGVTQVSTRRTGKCSMQESMRYDVPVDLLDAGRFELKVPFPKKEAVVTLSKEPQRDGVTVRVDGLGTTVIVPRRPPGAPKLPSGAYRLPVQFKIQDCKI